MDRWPATYQIIGKDILATHAVYWSTMLFALGLPPAQCIFAHGWWTVEGQKMSKSLGNAVDPNLLIDVYGQEPVRYFLLKQIPFGGDGNFSHDDFMVRFNADLANDYGNLGHRSLSMVEKWIGGVVPPLDAPTERDLELAALAQRTLTQYTEQIEALQFSVAFETLWVLVRAGNKYVDSEQPWKLNREGDTVRLSGVMRRALEICRIAAVLISPVMPEKSAEMLAKLGMTETLFEKLTSFDGLTEGATLTLGDPLVPRMQKLPPAILAVREAALANAPVKPKKKKKKSKKKVYEPIEIADFEKVELKVGSVLSAEVHPDAERLLVLKVDIGAEQPRQIVAGIASLYTPEDLVGKTVIVVANLKPAELRGVLSEGMLLAAGGKQVIGLAGIPEGASPGTTVR